MARNGDRQRVISCARRRRRLHLGSSARWDQKLEKVMKSLNRQDFRAVLVGLALAGSASAAEFWVSPAGDDANPGTQDRPFASLVRARACTRGEIQTRSPCDHMAWGNGQEHHRPRRGFRGWPAGRDRCEPPGSSRRQRCRESGTQSWRRDPEVRGPCDPPDVGLGAVLESRVSRPG